MIFEELRWLDKSELIKPAVKHGLNCSSIEGLDLFLIADPIINIFQNVSLSIHEILLEGDSLSNDVASHSLLLHLLQEVDPLLLCFYLCLPNQILSSLPDGVHEVRLQQVVVLV